MIAAHIIQIVNHWMGIVNVVLHTLGAHWLNNSPYLDMYPYRKWIRQLCATMRGLIVRPHAIHLGPRTICQKILLAKVQTVLLALEEEWMGPEERAG